MPFSVKRVMDIDRCVKVGMRLVMTLGTSKQFSPFLHDALAPSVREPLAQRAASVAILGSPMCIDLHRDHLVEVRFVACMLVTLAAQLVAPLAVHPPPFRALASFY